VKTLIIIPTYNEQENIANLIESLRNLKISNLEILVVDDSSPDGTGDIVTHESKKPGLAIHLLTQTTKGGLGKAYANGFQWAIKHDYTHVISMDADFSHDPKYVPEMLKVDENVGIVIGSRYIKGGGIVGWDTKRYLNSYGANIVTRIALGLKPKDVTAGYKRYTREFLESIDYKHIIASGYAFQVEMIYEAQNYGFSIVEIPIIFADRRVGQSKISGELKRSAKVVWKLTKKREGVRQFIKFCIVGAINTIVDWAFYAIFKTFIGSSTQTLKQIAKACSFVIAATSSYIMNRKWTFRSTDNQILKQAIKFIAISVGGLVINNSVFYLITSPKFLHLADILGLISGTAIATFWNFFGNRKWTFKED
jgi:dolichol-phosphate mannosyltransferase